MDACSTRIPSRVNMDKGNQSGQFCGLASPHQAQRHQILPGHQRDSKRAHEPNTKERAVDQAKRDGDCPQQGQARQESKGCVYTSV